MEMKLKACSSIDTASMQHSYPNYSPNVLVLRPTPGRHVVFNYRRLRNHGVPARAARSIVWDIALYASLYGAKSDFRAGNLGGAT